MDEGYEEKADRAEHELEEMEHESEQLGERIDETRADWERKKVDDAVPGAGGDPAAAESGLPPEADEPTGG